MLCLTSYLNVNEEMKVVLGASLRVLRTYLAIFGVGPETALFPCRGFSAGNC